MRTRSFISTLVLASLLTAALAVAQEGDPDTPDTQPDAPQARHIYTGEITDLEESSFRIKPWDPKLPRRVQITATATTRYFKQVEAGRDHLKPGDVVMVVQDPRRAIRLYPKRDETKDEKAAREARQKELRAEQEAKPGRARAVIRLWAGTEGGVSPQDRAAAQVFLRGARGHFVGHNRGGVPAPDRRTPRWVGIVKTTRPLVLTVGKDEKVFETYGETVWLDHLPIKPEDLRKGKTVVLQSPTPLGADGTLQALLIAQCPEPQRRPEVERKLILRERNGRR